jgi:hypothetical protein
VSSAQTRGTIRRAKQARQGRLRRLAASSEHNHFALAAALDRSGTVDGVGKQARPRRPRMNFGLPAAITARLAASVAEAPAVTASALSPFEASLAHERGAFRRGRARRGLPRIVPKHRGAQSPSARAPE